MSAKRPNHDEFLEPVSLSPHDASPTAQKGKLKWTLLLSVLLCMWTVAVFYFFRQSKGEDLLKKDPIPLPVATTTTVAQQPEVTATAEPITEVSKSLKVETDPLEATVFLNGKYVGLSPIELSEVEVGDTVGIKLVGYAPMKKSVTSQDLEKGMQVQLQGLQGKVRLNIAPSDSQVFLDGLPLTLPADGVIQLPLKAHTVRVEKAGFVPQEKKVTPAQAYERLLTFALVPHPTPTPHLPTGVEQANTETSMTNSQGLVMIRPEFPLEATLGSPRGTAGRQSNEVIRKVKLTRKFRLSQTEISNAQYRKFKATHKSESWKGVALNDEEMPVVGVTWEDAVGYCNWLSQQEGLPLAYVKKNGKWQFNDQPGTGYRLPTESEWETLARVGHHHDLFGWGNQMPPPQGAVNLAGKEMSRLLPSTLKDYQDPFVGPATVTAAGEGPFALKGLYDNVSEWMHEGYGIPPLGNQVVLNPMPPLDLGFHLIKGASWQDAGISELRIALRKYGNDAAVDLGFRVARYIEGPIQNTKP